MKRILLITFSSLLLSFTIGDSKSEYTLPRAAYSICTNDLDLDGDLDIVVGHNYNSQTEWSGLSIIKNTDEGYFIFEDSNYFFGWQPSVQSINLNNLTLPEIIAKKEDPVLETEYISIIYDNDFSNSIDYNLNTYEGVGIIKYGDIDGNNYNDLIVASNSGQFWGILYNDGTSNFSSPQYYNVTDYYPSDLACTDLNNDGRDDVVIVGQKTEVYFSYENGFQLLTLETNSFKGSVSISDFDNNGTKDIVASLRLYPYDYTLIKFYKNLGNNNVIAFDSVIFQPLCDGKFQVSDFNNDSLPDLLFHPSNHENLLILFNQGNFKFTDSVFIPTTNFGEASRYSNCADFDGNGYNDIVTIRYLHAPIPNLNILFNDGNGIFFEDPITNIHASNLQDGSQALNLNCFPNPMKRETTFEIDIKKTAHVELTVYNQQGRPITKLIKNQLEGGIHKIKWDGVDQDNHICNPGPYFAYLTVNGKFNQVIKLIII
ncbi:MAG: VCBS repeat-containing protein [Bacteroidales bacterium]|nr:VCBS repeat-containing protein [Bacteroidales bacterium]MCF8404794.1 VCBS repeat-containing protein [Bacteroidales bacterium]